ncbi:MAG: carbohydrate binding family 9 domain-containing protein [Elusimicrobia bacterium]|nr:carbohydrate binding family 9 domain-containing protein [Elusimicrobiota bacterium]
MSKLLILVLFLNTLNLRAENTGAVLEIKKIDSPPEIDGIINESEWKNASKISDFFQIAPKEGEPVSEKTTVYIGYDVDNLYAAFEAVDSKPDKIRAQSAPRDKVFDDDWIGLLLDTFGDQRRAYEFFSNPLGIQMDLFNAAGQEDTSPDYVWHNKARLNQDGYVVEFKIPFKSLRFPKTEIQKWRISFIRHIPRKNEKSIWPALYRNSGSIFLQMADLRGIERITNAAKFEFIPELTGSKSSPFETQEHAFHWGDWNLRSGANLKYIAMPNLSMDAAFSPDFSQVEADQPQITVNQRYPIFYSEKRPFFMEGSHFFSMPLTIVHTRTIVDPLYGFKLTGKEGRYSGGILAANDRSRDDAVFNISKIDMDVGNESMLGAIYSAMEHKNEYNRVGSVAGRFKLRKLYTIKFQGAESFTKTDLSGHKKGKAYYVSLSRDAKHLGFSAAYKDFHPDFEVESGFFERTGIKRAGAELWYKFWQNRGPLISFTPQTGYWKTYDSAAALTDEESHITMSFEFPLQTFLAFSYSPDNFEKFDGMDFTKHGWEFSASASPAKFLSGSFSIKAGDEINYVSEPPFLGDGKEMNFALALRPMSFMKFETLYLKSCLDAKSGERVFDENIWRAKFLYQVNREVSARVIYQYKTLEHSGFYDVLFTYLLTPGTAAHLGYDVSFEKEGGSLKNTKEVVFVKMSYLFRF